MPDELDVLIKTLQQQRDDLAAELTNSKREQEAAELLDTLRRLRKKSEELDETWRKQQSAFPR